MIKKVGVVDKPEAIIRYKKIQKTFAEHIEDKDTAVIQGIRRCVKKHSLISKFNSDEKADKYQNWIT